MNNIKLIFIILLGIILSLSFGLAQEGDIFEIKLSNGSVQKAHSFQIQKDEIVFYDLFNLEHIINISKITSFKKIKNQPNSYDKITLFDKTVKEGVIIALNPIQRILLLNQKKDTLFIPIKKIISISKGIINIRNSIKNRYELGASLGFPSAVNLMMAVWFDNIGLRISGLYIGIAKGVQFNFSYKFSENRNTYHSIALVFGNSDIQKDKFGRIFLKNFHWQYAGIAYDANFGGFWTEIGLSYGYGNYHNPQVIFQFGYSPKI